MGSDQQRSGSHGGSESGRSFRSSPRGLDLETIASGEDESELETAVSQNGAPPPFAEGPAWSRRATDPREEEVYTEKPLIPKQRVLGDETAGRARGWNLEEGGRMLPPLEENSGGQGGAAHLGGTGPSGGAEHAGKRGADEHAESLRDARGSPGVTYHAGKDRGIGVAGSEGLMSRGELLTASRFSMGNVSAQLEDRGRCLSCLTYCIFYVISFSARADRLKFQSR